MLWPRFTPFYPVWTRFDVNIDVTVSMLPAPKFSMLKWCRSYSFRSSRIRYYYPLSLLPTYFCRFLKSTFVTRAKDRVTNRVVWTCCYDGSRYCDRTNTILLYLPSYLMQMSYEWICRGCLMTSKSKSEQSRKRYLLTMPITMGSLLSFYCIIFCYIKYRWR